MALHPATKLIRRIATYLMVAAVAIAVTWFGMGALGNRREASKPTADVAGDPAAAAGDVDSIAVPKRVAELNHMAIAVAQRPTHAQQLTLRGELAIDPAKMIHLHARFPGTIVKIASIDEPAVPPMSKSPGRRPLAFMDHVTKGQPMAFMWSKDLGEKKSELVDALVNLRLNRVTLDRMNDLVRRGAASEKDVREAEREVTRGEVAVRKVKLTLKSWELSDEEIAQVVAEADRAREHKGESRQQDEEWARVEIKAPIDGTIVEWNVTTGDVVNDTTADLFKIADLSVLALRLHAYEEGLPYLQRLQKPIPVTIHLPSNPQIGPLQASIEQTGDLIDQSEHMAILIGHVANPRDDLKVGQFVTGDVALPPEEGVVEVPTRALVEDGTESLVFVQLNPDEYRFQPRRVRVARKYADVVQLRSQLDDEQKAAGFQELHEGERVAASETVQLRAVLQQKQLSAPASGDKRARRETLAPSIASFGKLVSMIAKLIHWSVNNPLIVVLFTIALTVAGGYAFSRVNVEAYPDPAPAIVEVIAQRPGRSAEEIERLVTVPLEVALSGMPGLKYIRSKSLFGLSYINTQFEYGFDYKSARQEVINRMQIADLPADVNPQISPRSPIGEILRYAVVGPKDAHGNSIYSLADLRSIESWTLERAFRRIPGIADVVSFGGLVKRYEIQPDPDRMKRYGITLEQLQKAIADSNDNVSGDYLIQGETASVVRGLGLIGRGYDPMQRTLTMNSAEQAARYLRSEEQRRLRQIRQIVLASTNNLPVRVDDVVEGGPLKPGEEESTQGVVVGHQTRLGKVALSRPREDERGRLLDAQGNTVWDDEDEVVQGLVLLRKGAESLPALKLVQAKIEELNNTPGRLPPGVRIDTFYDRADLINTTTETVEENLLVGILLVTVILLMFLSNIRSAIIIALNLPLALLFAFGALYARNESANLLSIGAVDFGIIVDSTVIMVENIYRVLSSGKYANLSLPDRIVRAAHEVERSLLFSTLIMVCAMLPLFTMKGAEGQLFRPMAETYAFALAGALLLAVTIAPVLCLLLFRNLKTRPDNWLVRMLKTGYLRQLDRLLNHRLLAVGGFAGLIAVTAFLLPHLGREFIPPLEEGHIWIRGIFPVSISLDQTADQARIARAILRTYPEVESVVCQLGRPDSGVDPTGFYSAEFFVPLAPQPDWPAVVARSGWWGNWWGGRRARTKPELVSEISAELNEAIPGVNWNFSQVIRDNVLEVLSGVQGENSVKIMGPDLDGLEKIGNQVLAALADVPGVKDVGLYRIRGQCNVELPIDRQKCSLWNVSVADVHNVIQTAIGGKNVSQMIEGEKSFDITIRWPLRLREDESDILDIPVDVTSHQVTAGSQATAPSTPVSGQSMGVSSTGSNSLQPTITGSQRGTSPLESMTTPRERLGDLITPLGKNDDDRLDPDGQFVRPGASTIAREEGSRLIAVKFGVRGRDLAGAVADARAKVAPLIPKGYRAEWSGEFQQMEEGERRLMVIVPLSIVLIFVLLYLAFRSLLDAFVVLANVLALSLGGVWALFLTGTNFSIAAAVGFTSIFGVAIMDGLLLVSSFNQLRSAGVPLREAILQGAERRVRPVMMTALTAIFGLLPAAISTKIGAQSQKPLAIVVVGSMLATLFLTRYLMPILYSFYGDREPPEVSGGLIHE